MDHVFGSRWLVEELSWLGFSISYDEVNRYKQSVIESESLDNLFVEYLPGAFTQWVADNVDHDVASLDGTGSLHGMGIIANSTLEDNVSLVPSSLQHHKKWGWRLDGTKLNPIMTDLHTCCTRNIAKVCPL